RLRALYEDEVVGDVPARILTDECPRYELELRPREAPSAAPPWGPPHERALVELLRSPNVRSKRWVYEQYDQLVGSRTVRRPGLDAAVLRLRPSTRGIAVSLDGQGRISRLDPRTGGALAVFESARNVACAGGTPLAFTDCLNFGNPEKPEQAWELSESIEGIAAAANALALVSGIGADVELPPDAARLFGEGGGQAIVACHAEFADTLRGVPLRRLGVVGGDAICGVSLEELREAWN